MSDAKKQSHWDDLAEDLGAEAPPEPAAPASDPPPPRDVPPPRPPRKPTPPKPAAPTDWSSLADGLGLPASAQDETSPGAAAPSDISPPAEEATPTSIAEAVDAVVEDDAGRGADDVSTDRAAADGSSESGEAPAKKRRRRRRGRGRGRGADKRDERDGDGGERTDSIEQDAGEVVVAELVTEPRQEDAGGEGTPAGEENGEGGEKRRKPRRRRGRRRKSKTTDDASTASDTPSDEEDDEKDTELELESDDVLTGYADGQDGADEDATADKDADDKGRPARKSSGGSQRQIPTWEEAIGVIVEVNMEAREKAGKGKSSAPRRGGRSRGGRGSRDGGRKR